jgi:hypothetical protein
MYWLMGEPLQFQTNNPVVLDLADEAFGRFPFESHPEIEPLLVQLIVHPDRNLFYDIPQTSKPVFHNFRHLFSITMDENNLAMIDLHQGIAQGFITPQLLDNRAFVRYTFVEGMSLAMLLYQRNFLAIHAACVVKNKTSVILQARAGVGKSTLAYACVRRGYKLVAEDVVMAKIHPENTTLWGSPWKFHLLPDAWQIFPELSDLRPVLQTNGEWKLEFDLEDRFPGSAQVSTNPGYAVLLTRGNGARTSIEPISASEACHEFEFIWPWETGWTPRHEAAARQLLSTGAYHLAMNGSPDQAVDLLDQICGIRQALNTTD